MMGFIASSTTTAAALDAVAGTAATASDTSDMSSKVPQMQPKERPMVGLRMCKHLRDARLCFTCFDAGLRVGDFICPHRRLTHSCVQCQQQRAALLLSPPSTHHDSSSAADSPARVGDDDEDDNSVSSSSSVSDDEDVKSADASATTTFMDDFPDDDLDDDDKEPAEWKPKRASASRRSSSSAGRTNLPRITLTIPRLRKTDSTDASTIGKPKESKARNANRRGGGGGGGAGNANQSRHPRFPEPDPSHRCTTTSKRNICRQCKVNGTGGQGLCEHMRPKSRCVECFTMGRPAIGVCAVHLKLYRSCGCISPGIALRAQQQQQQPHVSNPLTRSATTTTASDVVAETRDGEVVDDAGSSKIKNQQPAAFGPYIQNPQVAAAAASGPYISPYVPSVMIPGMVPYPPMKHPMMMSMNNQQVFKG